MHPRIRQLSYLLLALIVGIICPQAASGIEFSDPSFAADTLQVLPEGRYALAIAFPEAAHASYDGFAYISSMINWGAGTGAIHVMTEDGTFIPLAGGAPDIPNDIRFSNAAFGNQLFCTDAGHPASWTDGVYRVSPDGSSQLLTALGGGNPNPHQLAFGDGGAFGDWMYVALPDDGSANPAYRRAIVRVDPSGSYAGQLCTHSYGPSGLAFSTGGAFGEYLYFNCYSDSRDIYRVNAVGVVEIFAQSPDNMYICGFGRGGAFGTDLYVKKGDGIFRVTDTGDFIPFASNVVVGASAFDPTSGDMYVCVGGFGPILRIHRPGTSNAPIEQRTPRLVQLSDAFPNPANGQMCIRFAVPRRMAVELSVYDTRGRRLRKLHSAVADPVGEHVTYWDCLDVSGTPVPSGTYFLRLGLDGGFLTKRCVLVR